MRTGRHWTWAGLFGLALMAQGPVRAQEAISTTPAEKNAPAVPLDSSALDLHGIGAPAHGDASATPHVDASCDNSSCCGASGLVVNAEYLLLKPHRNAFDVGIIAPNTVTLPYGPVVSMDWGSRSGARVGAGYRLPGDGWEIMVNYTHLDTADNRVFIAPNNGILLATLTSGGGNDQVNRIDGGSQLQYHVIDLDISRYCWSGETFALRFFGGARAAIIDQSFGVNYSGGSLDGSSVFVNSPVNFYGGGLTGGAEGTWKCGHGWGLYSRARLSMLSGKFTNSLSEVASGNNVIVNVTEKYNNIIPVAEMAGGVCWQNEHWHFAIGYEATNWFNMVNSLDFPDGGSLGHVGRRTSDLMLEGLAVQLGVVF